MKLTITLLTALVAQASARAFSVGVLVETGNEDQQSLSITNNDNQICYLACFSEEPECNKEDGWYSSKQGECWTCCRDIGKEGASKPKVSQKQVTKLSEHHRGKNVHKTAGPFCTPCQSEDFECPEGTEEVHPFPDCKSCCISYNGVALSKKEL